VKIKEESQCTDVEFSSPKPSYMISGCAPMHSPDLNAPMNLVSHSNPSPVTLGVETTSKREPNNLHHCFEPHSQTFYIASQPDKSNSKFISSNNNNKNNKNGGSGNNVPPQLPSSLPPKNNNNGGTNIVSNNNHKNINNVSIWNSTDNNNKVVNINNNNNVSGGNSSGANNSCTGNNNAFVNNHSAVSSGGLVSGSNGSQQQQPPMNLSFPRIPPSPDSALGGWSTPSSNLSRHNSDASQRSFSSSSNNTTPPSPSNSPLLSHNRVVNKVDDFGKCVFDIAVFATSYIHSLYNST